MLALAAQIAESDTTELCPQWGQSSIFQNMAFSALFRDESLRRLSLSLSLLSVTAMSCHWVLHPKVQ